MISPTVQFGTAVTNTAGSFGSPSSSISRNRNTLTIVAFDDHEKRERSPGG
jgi:hypothetical protein